MYYPSSENKGAGSLFSHMQNVGFLMTPLNYYFLFRCPRARIHTRRCLRQEAEKSETYTYNPSEYSSYEAFLKGNVEKWKYQPFVVAFSGLSFMLYFFILREENHIDKAIGESMNTTIPQLEEATLVATIQDRRMKGLDTLEFENRLKEVRALAR